MQDCKYRRFVRNKFVVIVARNGSADGKWWRHIAITYSLEWAQCDFIATTLPYIVYNCDVHKIVSMFYNTFIFIPTYLAVYLYVKKNVDWNERRCSTQRNVNPLKR